MMMTNHTQNSFENVKNNMSHNPPGIVYSWHQDDEIAKKRKKLMRKCQLCEDKPVLKEKYFTTFKGGHYYSFGWIGDDNPDGRNFVRLLQKHGSKP